MISANDVKTLREKTGAGMLDCKKALEKTQGDIDKAVDFLREKGLAKAQSKQSRVAAEGLVDVVIDKNTAVIYELNSETDFVAKNENFKKLFELIGQALLKNNVKDVDAALKLTVEGKTIEEQLLGLTAKIGEKITLRRFEKLEKSNSQEFGRYIHNGGKIAVLTLFNGSNEQVAKNISMQVCAIKPQYLSDKDIDEQAKQHELSILKQQAINENEKLVENKRKPLNVIENIVKGRLKKHFSEICLLDQAFFLSPDKTVSQYLSENKVSIEKYVRFEVGEGIEKKQDNFAEEVKAQVQGQK